MKIFKLKNQEAIPANYHGFSSMTREHIEDEKAFALSKECSRVVPIEVYNSQLSSCHFPFKPVSRMFTLSPNYDY